MNQYKDKEQLKSLIKQAYLINQVLDEYGFTSVLDVGTGPGIIKRVLVKQGKLCHTVEQDYQWADFKRFNPEIDFRMSFYKDGNWDFRVPLFPYDCVILSRFFDMHHTVHDFEIIKHTLNYYSNNILILQHPHSWQIGNHLEKRAIKHSTFLWPIYVLTEMK